MLCVAFAKDSEFIDRAIEQRALLECPRGPGRSLRSRFKSGAPGSGQIKADG